MNFDLKYYLSVFFRRSPIFFIVVVLFTALSLSVAYLLPTTYEAQARLLVESAQIPDELAASTVQTDASEQLQILEQRLMTRANLLDIANRRNVFPNQRTMSPDRIVDAMRDKTRIQRSGGRGNATLMVITFKATTPQTTAQVANDYVTLILQDSVEFRTDKAGSTMQFFEQEVARLATELETQSTRILTFKNANSEALPEGLEYRLSRQALLQERVSQLQRDQTLLGDQRNRLIQIFNATGQISQRNTRKLSPDEQRLQAAQKDLADALTLYSAENPRVKILQAQVDRLEDAVKAQSPQNNGEVGKADTSLLDLQLAEIDTKLRFVADEITTTVKELNSLQVAITKTPANAIALEGLERDYSNTQSQYNNAVDRLAKAATGERIELLAKGQRISVIEQAIPPTEPTAPNRALIAVGGGLFSIFAGIGVIVLLELLNRSVRRSVDLTKNLGITPLSNIPYTRTARQASLRRLIIAVTTIVVVAGVPSLLYYIHTAYLPLDLLVDKYASKLGF